MYDPKASFLLSLGVIVGAQGMAEYDLKGNTRRLRR
jgi:hypothetical protein